FARSKGYVAILLDYMARMKPLADAGATTSDRLTTVLSYGALLLLGYWVYAIFAPYLVPLAWSAVLAIFFYPLYVQLAKLMKPTWAALVATLGVTLLLIVPALVLLVYTARQTLDAVGTMQSSLGVHGQGPNQGLILSAEEWVRARLPA